MMKATKADTIFHYIETAGGRGWGKTRLMLNSIEHFPRVVVVAANNQHAEHLRKRIKEAGMTNKVCSLGNLQTLAGVNMPCIMDHYALQTLWEMREQEWVAQAHEEVKKLFEEDYRSRK